MKQNKVSLICPIYNEVDSIKGLMDSMLKQTKKPEEIIFVDSFSNDGTAEIIKDYSKRYPQIKIIQKRSNIAKARNIAVKNAKNEIIACTDAGCQLNRNWLEEITKPFPKYDFVAGNYGFLAKNDFEFFQGNFVVQDVDKVTRISSRSIAFKKAFWKKARGYPENTYTGEDTNFNFRLLNAGAKLFYAKKAILKWKMRPTWGKFAKQFYLYGFGDGKMRNIFKIKTNAISFIGFLILILAGLVFLFINAWISLVVLLLLVGFFSFEGLILWKKTKKFRGFFYGFLLSLIKRKSYALGVLIGLLK